MHGKGKYFNREKRENDSPDAKNLSTILRNG
jgi:hypothetical protein